MTTSPLTRNCLLSQIAGLLSLGQLSTFIFPLKPRNYPIFMYKRTINKQTLWNEKLPKDYWWRQICCDCVQSKVRNSPDILTPCKLTPVIKTQLRPCKCKECNVSVEKDQWECRYVMIWVRMFMWTRWLLRAIRLLLCVLYRSCKDIDSLEIKKRLCVTWVRKEYGIQVLYGLHAYTVP